MSSKSKSAAKAKPKITERAVRFLKSAWSELKKVHWPTRREILVYTAIVLVAVLIVAIIIYLFDSLFAFLMRLVM